VTGTAHTCSRCIMDSTVPGLKLDQHGACQMCHAHDRLDRAYYSEQDPDKKAAFLATIEQIKREGRGKPHDCVLPLSGGGDSSWALVQAVELGLRPVAYHFDNGWVSDIGRQNLETMTSKLGVPLKTLRVPWEQLGDAFRACLEASIPEPCLPCLVAVFSLAYRAAEIEGLRSVIFSSSPLTEGIAPLGWSYVDGRYLESVVRDHGQPATLDAVQEFNRLRARHLMAGALLRRTRVIMLPLYLEWDEPRFKVRLRDEYGWIDGGKHADCMYTPFRTHLIYKKFGYDLRRLAPAAQVRAGRISRERALQYFEDNPMVEDVDNRAMVLERLGLTAADYQRILDAPHRSFRDFRTYYPLIRRIRPLIRQACKRGLLAEHVIDKFED